MYILIMLEKEVISYSIGMQKEVKDMIAHSTTSITSKYISKISVPQYPCKHIRVKSFCYIK